MRLGAVQIINPVSGNGGEFDAVEGGYTVEDDTDHVPDFQNNQEETTEAHDY